MHDALTAGKIIYSACSVEDRNVNFFANQNVILLIETRENQNVCPLPQGASINNVISQRKMGSNKGEYSVRWYRISKSSLFSPVCGVILSFWPYTSKFRLAFSIRNYLLCGQTFSFLCIFIFYEIKFCAMMLQSYYITVVHKKSRQF